MRPVAHFLLSASILFSSFFAGSCSYFEEKGEKNDAPELKEAKQELTSPPEYTGPIDPEWPPSRPGSIEFALEASRIYRESLAAGGVAKKPNYQVDGQGYYVEKGKVGDFNYIEVVLGKNAHPDHPMPLIVILHGRGGRPTIPQGPYDTQMPLRLFIPQGPDKLGTGYNWLATWTNSGQTQLLARSLSARVDQLAAAIRAFRGLRPTLGLPIVMGFSQGGILSFTLATRYPGDFSAAFPIAGWLPPSLYPDPKRDKKFPYIFAQHGGVDKTVPTAYGRDTVKALRARGLRVDFREVPDVGHIVSPSMSRDLRVALKRFVGGYFGGAWKESEARFENPK
jgi:phospholipase/carboxylesterase